MNIKLFLKAYTKYLLVILFIIIFFFIAEDLLENTVLNMDHSIYDNIIKPMISDTNTKIFKLITDLASVKVLLPVSLLSFFIFKNKKYTFFMLLNLGLAISLNLALKEIFSRARPEDLMLIQESGYSFPSGHSMVAMAFYGFFIFLLLHTNWKKIFQYLSAALLGIMILAIGVSRIYLGVHYTSDVIAGFSIALAYLLIFTTIVSNSLYRPESVGIERAKGPLWKSFYFAFQGIVETIRIERNMAIHFTIMFVIILFGFTFSISVGEWIACILLFGLVIALELMNTAVENTIDICMPKFDPKAKIAKDAAAGAVLVAAISATAIGLIIFIPKIIELFYP